MTKVNINKLILALTILTQCGWSFGWQESLNPNSIVYPGSPATTNQTLSNAQSGNIIVFNGSSNNTQFTLPAATLGLDFTIVADVTNYVTIKIQSGDIINFASLATSASISNSSSHAKGDSIELICQTTGQWSIKNRVGTWS